MSTSELTSEIPKKIIITEIHSVQVGGIKNYLRELWQCRELFYLFAWRDLLVRYRQTVIGLAWIALRPLITVLVFTLVFGKVANLPSGNIPYVLFVFAAMLPWQFFSNALSEAGNSLINNTSIISKIYLPRLLIPLASLTVSFMDALVVALLFAGVMIWFQFLPSWQIIFLPFFIVWLVVVTFSISIWVAALNVTYRDFRFLIPFMVQLGVYVCPVGFGSSIVPHKYQWLYYLNPLASIIDGFRWSLFGASAQQMAWQWLPLSLLTSIIILCLGCSYFYRTEATFADRI